ncbi:universal stress protein [Streptomyces sp. A5-4]|uniref:universal stress protein n=1 Tax=Streptomyces sp. A5-4 TaxID=3384771 RepID=UPI003DA8B38A
MGIDGSAESLNAANWAAREARRRKLTLRLVHVDDAPAQPTGLSGPDAPARGDRGGLDRAVRSLSHRNPGLDIISGTLTGPPAPALVNAAQGSSALVVGSQGHSALAGFLVGSVALAVTAQALCPVALIRAPRPQRPVSRRTRPAAIAPVVAGVDLDHDCDAVLAQAFAAAAQREAPLIVVSAWSLPLLPDTSSGIPEPETTRQRQLTALVGPWRSKYPHTPVTERLAHGRAGHILHQASTGASLLVVGRRTHPAESLGRTLHAVIHHVACPVVVIPHD